MISLCIGAFNLIPCKPFDGGNIIHTILCRFARHQTADNICFVISTVTVIPMIVAGVFLMKSNGNITLLAVAVYVAMSCFLEYKSKTALV